jgi:hypothetical protein
MISTRGPKQNKAEKKLQALRLPGKWITNFRHLAQSVITEKGPGE